MTRSPHLRRIRSGLVALTVASCSTIALAAGPAPVASAQTEVDAPPPAGPATQVVYGKGDMTSAEVVLSGPTPPPAPTSRSATATPAPGTTGWSTTADLIPGTQMVALTWDATDSVAGGTVAVRSRHAGTWRPWESHTPDLSDLGDEAERIGTDLLWLGEEGADAVEIRIETGPLVGLELMKMHYTPGEPEVVETPQARSATDRAATARPPIRPRSEWASGGYRCSGGPEAAPALKHVVVHHTAGTNTYTAAAVPNIINATYLLHTNGNGWCDIGYNFLVDRFGTIWQGRSGDMTKPIIGGHARGFNTGSVGVSLMGQFQPGASGVPASGTPTNAMLDSTARVIAWQLSLHGLNPHGNATVTSLGNDKYPAGRSVTLPVVNYHGQNGATACPGANVITKMPFIRDAAGMYMGAVEPNPGPGPEEPPPPTSRDWAPFRTVEDLVWRQYVDFRRHHGEYADRLWWAQALNGGSTNRNALVAALVRSDHVQDKTADPIRLYQTYFDRIPDSAGIRYWWGEMDAGRSIRTVSARFAGSSEFRTMYGNLGDEAFVRLVYRNVLDREGSTADIAYWTNRIRNRQDSRGGVMVLFAKSKEYKDKTQVQVEITLIHEVMLGRAISSSSLATWIPRVRDDGIGTLIGNLYGSQEYARRFG